MGNFHCRLNYSYHHNGLQYSHPHSFHCLCDSEDSYCRCFFCNMGCIVDHRVLHTTQLNNLDTSPCLQIYYTPNTRADTCDHTEGRRSPVDSPLCSAHSHHRVPAQNSYCCRETRSAVHNIRTDILVCSYHHYCYTLTDLPYSVGYIPYSYLCSDKNQHSTVYKWAD